MSKSSLTIRAGRPSELNSKATTLASLADKAPAVRINFDLERDYHIQLKRKNHQGAFEGIYYYSFELMSF